MAPEVDNFDPLIHIEFGKSRSKYFENALSTAKRQSKIKKEALFVESQSLGNEPYHFYTSDPSTAREVWKIVDGWQSSTMEVEGDNFPYNPCADEEDLRRVGRRKKKGKATEEIDGTDTKPLIEVRFGPSSSKYATKAVHRAKDLDKQNDHASYKRVTGKVYDDNKAEHLFVTTSAAEANQVYDIVENWKNSEIRIDGRLANERELEALARQQAPAWVWIVVAIILVISVFFSWVESL